jgi:UDP-N-acetylmuramoyl-L-alanyl-D-glutamate--2,6-diaminopimelate ligase
MKLFDLLNGLIAEETALPECEITGLAYDSRKVKPGDLFIALRGEHTDGHKYLSQALENGAVAVLVEEKMDVELPQIVVEKTLPLLSSIADRFFDHPSADITCIGITGSNGKTTTCYLLETMLLAAGENTGLLGTIEYRWGDCSAASSLTSPLALELHSMLAQMRGDGVESVVMEASSHAIALHRLDNVRWDGALFTNLSQDHLDFHGTMENYGQTKMRLFTEFLPHDAVAVVNGDDAWGKRIAEKMEGRECFTFGATDADLYAGKLKLSRNGMLFQFNTPDDSTTIESELLGMHNFYNVLAAASMAWALGYPMEAIADGAAAVKCVPGRLEKVATERDLLALVDYAHTPDGLDKVLTTLAEIPHKRIITVMGCGGDRDRDKRHKMGAITMEKSDIVIVTSDNPRSEDPNAIIEDILPGLAAGEKGKDYYVVPERETAIRESVRLARSGDIILVAGKGHETTQTIGTDVLPFDDREVLGGALREK